jgi:hypothetical protein
MKWHRVLIVIFAAWYCTSSARGAEPAGDLYQLGIALDQTGMRGGWSRIGEAGTWKGVRAGAILNDQLYTAETDGTLRATRLDNGQRTQIGGADFGQTTFMFAEAGSLWTIESTGNLYRVDPTSGAWSPVGSAGAYGAVRAGATFEGRLYTAEMDGALRVTNLADGSRRQIGKAEFGNTAALLASAGSLWTIDTDGNLFRVDARSGRWEHAGPAQGWRSLLAAVAIKDQLYSIQGKGTLHEARLPGGKRHQLGKADFGNTAFLFAGSQQLYTIETDGSLYAVYIRPPESIDSWDCFPREFEKVFQEQASAFFRRSYPRQILGNRATHAEILGGLAWLRSQATSKDMVVIYFTSHGGTDPTEGWAVVTADGKTLWGHELKLELAKLPCHALVFIETCGSGGFAHRHPKDPPVPANVTTLCACTGKQTARNELDIAALEALWGRADFSRDGVVELDEMLRYVELRYQDMYPASKPGPDVLRPVMVKAKSVPGSIPLTRVSPRLGAVVHDGGLYAALVNKQEGDQYRVHILGYNNQPGAFFVTNTAPRDNVCLPDDGPPLMVEQNGSWYPARLVSQMGDQYRVHYLGYNEEEVVTRERIKPAFVAGR